MSASASAVSHKLQAPQRLDFNSHTYDKVIENCFGRDIRDQARALLSTTEYQEMITRNLYVADKHADALAQSMRKDPRIKADYELAVVQGIEAVAEPCDELVAFMDHAVNIPEFFDRELIELGAKVFMTRLNPISFFAYGWPGAALQTGVLGITASVLLTNQPPGKPLTITENSERPALYKKALVRFMETFKWFSAVAQPGAGQPYTNAFKENCRIRLIHAHVRTALNKKINQKDWNFDPPIGWQEDELGTPLSAADGSIVVTTMATSILMAAKHLDLPVSEREMQALFQFTSYLNYMQGVPEKLLFPDADDTAVYFSAYLMSLNPRCNHDWVTVAFNTIFKVPLEEAMFPNSKVAQKLLNGLLNASWNEVYDKDFRRLYAMETEAALPYRLMFKSTKLSFKLYNRLARRSPWMQDRLNDFGMLLWNDIFPTAERKIKQHYAAVAEGTELAHT